MARRPVPRSGRAGWCRRAQSNSGCMRIRRAARPPGTCGAQPADGRQRARGADGLAAKVFLLEQESNTGPRVARPRCGRGAERRAVWTARTARPTWPATGGRKTRHRAACTGSACTGHRGAAQVQGALTLWTLQSVAQPRRWRPKSSYLYLYFLSGWFVNGAHLLLAAVADNKQQAPDRDRTNTNCSSRDASDMNEHARNG
eukprot:scaffold14596_cov112-Isochrysis_galbana.AAC.4